LKPAKSQLQVTADVRGEAAKRCDSFPVGNYSATTRPRNGGAISSVVCAALIRQFISSGKYNCRARLRKARKGPAVDDLGVRLVAEKLALTFVHTGGVENQ